MDFHHILGIGNVTRVGMSVT